MAAARPGRPAPGAASRRLLQVLRLALLLLLGLGSPGAEAKRVAVLGGVMKSHHLAMMPLVEGLLERGHEVTLLLPNTTDARGFFPSGISAGNSGDVRPIVDLPLHLLTPARRSAGHRPQEQS